MAQIWRQIIPKLVVLQRSNWSNISPRIILVRSLRSKVRQGQTRKMLRAMESKNNMMKLEQSVADAESDVSIFVDENDFSDNDEVEDSGTMTGEYEFLDDDEDSYNLRKQLGNSKYSKTHFSINDKGFSGTSVQSFANGSKPISGQRIRQNLHADQNLQERRSEESQNIGVRGKQHRYVEPKDFRQHLKKEDIEDESFHADNMDAESFSGHKGLEYKSPADEQERMIPRITTPRVPYQQEGKYGGQNAKQQLKGTWKKGFENLRRNSNEVNYFEGRNKYEGRNDFREQDEYEGQDFTSGDLMETDKFQGTLKAGKRMLPFHRDYQSQPNHVRHGQLEGRDGSGMRRNQRERRENIEIREGNDLLFGCAPCLIALQQGKREFYNAFLIKNFMESIRPEAVAVMKLLQESSVNIKVASKNQLRKLTQGRVHQGVCLETSRLRYVAGNSLSELPINSDQVPFQLILDQIKDPMNMGALLRSAYFLGVDRVVVSKRNCCPLTPVVSKASSGVMEIMQVYAVEDLKEYLETQKKGGWTVVAATSKHLEDDPYTLSCQEMKVDGPTVLVVGNEGHGLSSEIKDVCQQRVNVPSGRSLHPSVDSLNVSVATGILLHSFLKNR